MRDVGVCIYIKCRDYYLPPDIASMKYNVRACYNKKHEVKITLYLMLLSSDLFLYLENTDDSSLFPTFTFYSVKSITKGLLPANASSPSRFLGI